MHGIFKINHIFIPFLLQAMRKNFAPYLSYKRDNNELLLFALRALSRDTAAYMRNRYGTEQELIEIAEGDLLDKVRATTRDTLITG